jgi:hypothetical protein
MRPALEGSRDVAAGGDHEAEAGVRDLRLSGAREHMQSATHLKLVLTV